MLPHNRSLDDPEEMAEERRLFYVGLTRAKKRVYLVRASQRSTYGSFQDSIPSRFLDDIPEEMIQTSNSRGYGFSTRRSASTTSTWGDSRSLRSSAYGATPQAARASSAPILQARFRPGMRIRHSAWGEGLVIDSRLQDGDETVDVAFESVGFKRLVASLANLEILK
jgi:DNA helicase-2/ATP-dependent DNA helicase PcrA